MLLFFLLMTPAPTETTPYSHPLPLHDPLPSSPAPSTATGTPSPPASSAAWNAPPWNPATAPERLRVPSGKMHRLPPARSSSADWRMKPSAARRLLRSMNTLPIPLAYQPPNGTFVISCLSRHCRGTGTARNSAQMPLVDV